MLVSSMGIVVAWTSSCELRAPSVQGGNHGDQWQGGNHGDQCAMHTYLVSIGNNTIK